MFWIGAIVSLCYVPGLTGAYIATQWPVLSIILPFALARSGPFTVFHLAGLAFVAFAFVGVQWALAPYASVFAVWQIIIMALAVWFGTTLESTQDLFSGLAVGGAVSSAASVVQFFGWDILPVTSIHPAGIYLNSVQQGTVLAVLVVALVAQRKWLWALPLVPGLMIANSRGAYVALAIGLLAAYVRRTWVLVAVAAVGALLFTAPLSPSDQLRMLIWNTALHNMTLWGWGPGSFYAILIPDGGTFSYPEYAHNDALQLAFEYGVGAALPLAVFAFALSRTSDAEWPAIVAFVTAGCYSMPLWMPVASFLALVSVGRVLRNYGLVRRERDGWRLHVVSWRPGYQTGSGAGVPVAPHN